MHIDAVLQFIVEYPLDWKKDRRIIYGTNDGEVRWTHPDDTKIMLRIFSYKKQSKSWEPAQRLASELPDYPGLNVTLKETSSLPAGDATHLMAQTPKAEIEAYQLTTSDRNYTIALVVPLEALADYAVVISEVIQSFNIAK